MPLDSHAARQAAALTAPTVMVDGQPQHGIEALLVTGASPPRLHEALSFPRRGVLVRPCPTPRVAICACWLGDLTNGSAEIILTPLLRCSCADLAIRLR